MPIHIRPVALQDLSAVHALDARVYPGGSYPRFTLRQFYDLHGPHFKVALAEGGVVGYILAAFEASAFASGAFAAGALEAGTARAWILSLSTDPDFRGHGIATELLRAAIHDLRDAGATAIQLTVSEQNHPALHLYRDKFGFQVAGHEEDYYGDGASRLLLRLSG